MDQDAIIQGSIAIAEFLQWDKETVLPNHYTVTGEWIKFDFIEMTAYRPSEMRFHKDWNWLMMAWDKLRRVAFEENDDSYPHPFCEMTDCWEMYCLLVNIHNCFEILIEAIKWHNTTKQQS